MTFPNIDPIFFSLGPLQVRWYGLMYVIGFCCTYFLVKHQIKTHDDRQFAPHFENLNFFLLISVIIGGRLGYVLFYNLPHYLRHPMEIFATWHGGMSFHGGCLTLIIVGWIFCRRKQLNFWKTADYFIVTVPAGLFFGRVGNFINAELFGRTTDVPWAMIFPGGGPIPRHPSQLYEALLEGIVLFILLWSLHNKPFENKRLWPHGSMLALFLTIYGFFRFLVEFTREPDMQIGFLFSFFTMGQALSSLMIIAGIILYIARIRSSGQPKEGLFRPA